MKNIGVVWCLEGVGKRSLQGCVFPQSQFDSVGGMDVFQNGCYKTLRLLMLSTGLWPNNHPKVNLLLRIIVCITALSCADVQIAKLITCANDFVVFLRTFPLLMANMICVVKYCTGLFNQKLMKEIFEHIKHDWNTTMVEHELKIMNKYAGYARIFSMYYIICMCSSIGVFTLLQFAPCILDLVLPLGEPRPRHHALEAEYFVDQEKYFVSISVHTIITLAVGFTICAVSDSVFITCIFHACGAFCVLGYRFEHLFNDVVDSIKDTKDKEQTYVYVIRVKKCIKYQCRIFKYMSILNSCYGISYFVQLLLSILITTGLFTRVFIALTSMKNLSEVVICSVHICAQYFAIFLNILPAQMLLNYSSNIFHKMYCAHWYVTPLDMRKSTLLIMQNSAKPYGLTFCNITASVEVFAMIVQSSVSYFMVLYSLQQ